MKTPRNSEYIDSCYSTTAYGTVISYVCLPTIHRTSEERTKTYRKDKREGVSPGSLSPKLTSNKSTGKTKGITTRTRPPTLGFPEEQEYLPCSNLKNYFPYFWSFVFLSRLGVQGKSTFF